ncbi:MAG: hypothetical protein ACLFMT_01575 [Halobacteriales archaeon]
MDDVDVDCAVCGETASPEEWCRDPVCAACGTEHVVPRLHWAREACERGLVAGMSLEDVVDRFGLSDDEALDLLVALGCPADAALDVDRVVLRGRVRSEWRRAIDRTREDERAGYRRVREVLEGYGVEFEPPEDD